MINFAAQNWYLLLLAAIALIGFSSPKTIAQVFNSLFRTIPMGYAGLRTSWGGFDRKEKSNGKPMLVLPIINEFCLIPIDTPYPNEITAMIQTQDGEALEVKLLLIYKVDFELLEKYYYAIKNGEAELKEMIGALMIDLLGRIASGKKLTDFYEKREAVRLALNCLARLSEMPHLKPSLIKIKKGEPIPECILDFYDQYKKEVVALLGLEMKNVPDHSPIESGFGVDVLSVEIIKISFSPETQKALNKKREQAAMKEAADSKFTLVERFNKLLGDPRAALAAAEVSLGQTTDNRKFQFTGDPLVKMTVGGDHGK